MRNAYEVINKITKALFAPNDRHLVNWINQIAKKNQEILGPDVQGYLYLGVFYKPTDYPYRGRPKEVKLLHPSLAPQMERWLKEATAVKHERAMIHQTLFLLLDPCLNFQDIRDALPECLVEVLPELSVLPRQREPAYTLTNPRHILQYMKQLPKMEEYAALRFIS